MVKWLFFRQIIFRTIAVLLLVFIFSGSITCPKLDEQLDFTAAFYVAAHMAKNGKASDIYPEKNETSFSAAPFNVYAHKLLPGLGIGASPFFQYPPLVAFLLEPLSLMSPQTAMVTWQIISLLSLFICARLFSQLNKGNTLIYFWNSLVYLPIIHTLFIGQIGLTLLCLPLAIGYYYLIKGSHTKSGLVWSLLILKPQFIIVPAFFAIVLASLKKSRCLGSLVCGVLLLNIANFICLGANTFFKWLYSLRLNAEILSDPTCRHKLSLVSSCHEIFTGLFPANSQPMTSSIIYLLSAAIVLHAFYSCRARLKNLEVTITEFAPILLVISLLLLPLSVPYLRYYDLSIFVLAGMAFFGHPYFKFNQALKQYLLVFYILIDLYLLGLMFAPSLAPSFIQVIIFLGAYFRMITILPKLKTKMSLQNN